MGNALRGAALALGGALFVEILIAAGLKPYSPLGWPGLGIVAAVALYGTRGAIGAAPVALLYYLGNLAKPERFQVFFADWRSTFHWVAGIAFLAGLAWLLGARLRRAERLERELRTVHERLEAMAQRDSLTGLANRALFRDRLDQALLRAQRSSEGVALLFVDVDRFKAVNDTYGHAAGDAILLEFAARLRTCVRETDTVARMGGDEFVVLLDGIHGPENARLVAAKVLESVRAELHFGEQPIRTSASIGVALYETGMDASALLQRADEALYAAKGAGRDQYRMAGG